MNFFRKNILLIALIVIGFSLRFLWLNNVPNSTNYDQLHYALNVASFQTTGLDNTGTISLLDILLFRYPANESAQAELPYFLELPFISIMGLSLVSVALANVLLGTGTIILMYLIGKKLFNREVGLIAAALATINPWFIFISRTSYEAVPATFFFLAALYVLLVAKNRQLLLAAPLMLLAFYSYIGTKLIFLPFFALCLLYSYFEINKKHYQKIYLLLGGFCVLITAFFLFQLHAQPNASRISEIVTPNNPLITKQVDAIRKLSFVSPLTPIFENKYTIYLKTMVVNVFNVFSPGYLFVNGDNFFSQAHHGLFYYLDALFLIIGFGAFLLKKNKLLLFFISLILLSLIPQIVHEAEGGGNFTPHISLLIPLLLFIIALGISQTWQFVSSIKYGKVFQLVIVGGYIFLSLNFLNVFFNQSPLNGAIFSFPTRVLSQYAVLASSQQKRVIIHVGDPSFAYKSHILYSNGYNLQANNLLKKNSNSFFTPTVRFVQCTAKDEWDNNPSIPSIYQSDCEKRPAGPTLGISQLSDSGDVFNIYNDTLCDGIPLNNYLANLHAKDLAIETLSTQDFCQKFLTRH